MLVAIDIDGTLFATNHGYPVEINGCPVVIDSYVFTFIQHCLARGTLVFFLTARVYDPDLRVKKDKMIKDLSLTYQDILKSGGETALHAMTSSWINQGLKKQSGVLMRSLASSIEVPYRSTSQDPIEGYGRGVFESGILFTRAPDQMEVYKGLCLRQFMTLAQLRDAVHTVVLIDDQKRYLDEFDCILRCMYKIHTFAFEGDQ